MNTEKPKKIFACCNRYASQGHTCTCENHKHRRKLKPCPFCQEPAEILPQEPLVAGLKHWLVRCTSCQCRMQVFTNYLETVRATWNYRKEQTQVTKEN